LSASYITSYTRTAFGHLNAAPAQWATISALRVVVGAEASLSGHLRIGALLPLTGHPTSIAGRQGTVEHGHIGRRCNVALSAAAGQATATSARMSRRRRRHPGTDGTAYGTDFAIRDPFGNAIRIGRINR
jgi:hypothetical protein